MRTAADKFHSFLTRLLLLILILFMISIGLRFFTRQILVEKLKLDNAFTRLVLWDAETLKLTKDTTEAKPEKTTIGIDWAAQYPFSVSNNSIVQVGSQAGMLEAIKNRYINLVERLTSVIDNYADLHLMFRASINEGASKYEELIGWNLAGSSEYNNVIDIGDGYLTTFNPEKDVSANIEAITSLQGFLDSVGVPLLFVQVPPKISREDINIDNVIDFSNRNTDRLVLGLLDNKVNVLDLREPIQEQGLDYHALFYNTDHHWRAETGLWAAGEIAKKLNRTFGYNIDSSIFEPDKYTYDSYKNWFLGSLGKKATLARAKPDDIVLIYPKYDINITLKIPSLGTEKSGGFNALYVYSHIQEKDLYHKNPYAAYLGDDFPLVQIINQSLPTKDKKLLMIGDSSDNSLVPFISLGVNQIDSIDLRHFTGSLRSLIAANGYDLVFITYGDIPGIEYESHTNLYDFR